MDLVSVLKSSLLPACDAMSSPLVPFSYRWRLLALQPLVLLINAMEYFPWALSKAYAVHWIPTRTGHSVRAIVFQPPRPRASTGSRPLHLSVHAGGFLGGIAEYNAGFAQLLAHRTGAVVVCTSYRPAPRHPFPAAIDDVDDVVAYLLDHAERLFAADPRLFTVSGFSAGANLALAASQQPRCHPPAPTAIKASVTFYAPVRWPWDLSTVRTGIAKGIAHVSDRWTFVSPRLTNPNRQTTSSSIRCGGSSHSLTPMLAPRERPICRIHACTPS